MSKNSYYQFGDNKYYTCQDIPNALREPPLPTKWNNLNYTIKDSCRGLFPSLLQNRLKALVYVCLFVCLLSQRALLRLIVERCDN